MNTAQISSTAAGAGASAIATGAGAGAVAGPIGAAVGAVVGVVVGILTKTNNTASHIGTWDSQLLSAVDSMPTSVFGLGRQFAWNENSHGLVQMIEAALACGAYMSWDSSLISSYDVCANWAVTFGTAVQNVARTLFLNPYGPVSVSIPLSPGAGGVAPFTFAFTTSGSVLTAGPDAISAAYIMGKNGVMEAMMTALGGQAPQNIAANGTNATAQKIFALMIDYWWGQYLPQYTPAQLVAANAANAASNAAAAISAAAAAANTAASNGTNPQTAATVAATVATTPIASQSAPPTIATTTTTVPSTGATVTTPVVAPADTGALVTSLVASGTEPSDAIAAGNASLEANGIDSTAPESQAALQSAVSAGGLSTTDWFLIGGGAIAVLAFILLSRK